MTCNEILLGAFPTPSPFSQVIALGWYDGPVEGFARCAVCENGFHFDLGAWDGNRRTRIYEFHELSAGSFDEAVLALKPLGAPKWPTWVPSWKLASSQQLSQIDAELARIISTTLNEGLVIASRDGLDEIVAARELSLDVVRLLPSVKGEQGVFDEWAAVLSK